MTEWYQQQYLQQPVQQPQPQPVTQELCCYYCGSAFKHAERCIERMRGVVGRGEKSGQPMVVEDTYDKEEVIVLHEECELPFMLEYYGHTEDEIMRFCAGCGAKLDGE